jgi:gliding motility associated protien GldN
MENMIMKNSLLIIVSFLIVSGLLGQQPTQAQVIDAPAYDGVYVKETVPNLEPVPYSHLREADVFWAKRVWRTIDLREKINHPLYYPITPVNQRKNLMTVFMEGLKENMITAYTTDQFDMPLSYEEMMARLERQDTITAYRDYPPYEEYDTVISQPFDAGSVLMFRLKEDWFFDKQRSVLECRILGISPVIIEYDEEGEMKGFRTIFWIYFPHARKLMATNEVFNRHNDTERRSFDDIFFKRMFNSYVYKESNVYDRFISDYAIGMDALLESERIKDEVFIKEHDLWEY